MLAAHIKVWLGLLWLGSGKPHESMLEEEPPIEVQTSGSTGGRGGNLSYEASLKGML